MELRSGGVNGEGEGDGVDVDDLDSDVDCMEGLDGEVRGAFEEEGVDEQ